MTPTSGSAFQAEYVQAQAMATGDHGVGGGVAGRRHRPQQRRGQRDLRPQQPDQADATGYVRRPDIDMGEQMGNMIMAQRAFQANASVVDRAKEIYQSAIDIGKKA